MKWLNLTIKLLHALAVIGTYAAVFEILLKVTRAVSSFLVGATLLLYNTSCYIASGIVSCAPPWDC